MKSEKEEKKSGRETKVLKNPVKDIVIHTDWEVSIDAVCDVALRIIGKLKNGSPTGGPPLLGPGRGSGGGERPPTPAMKRFAVVLARQKRIKLPAGYGTSGSICRAFLDQHAPKKAVGETTAERGSGVATCIFS